MEKIQLHRLPSPELKITPKFSLRNSARERKRGRRKRTGRVYTLQTLIIKRAAKETERETGPSLSLGGDARARRRLADSILPRTRDTYVPGRPATSEGKSLRDCFHLPRSADAFFFPSSSGGDAAASLFLRLRGREIESTFLRRIFFSVRAPRCGAADEGGQRKREKYLWEFKAWVEVEKFCWMDLSGMFSATCVCVCVFFFPVGVQGKRGGDWGRTLLGA